VGRIHDKLRHETAQPVHQPVRTPCEPTFTFILDRHKAQS